MCTLALAAGLTVFLELARAGTAAFFGAGFFAALLGLPLAGAGLAFALVVALVFALAFTLGLALAGLARGDACLVFLLMEALA